MNDLLKREISNNFPVDYEQAELAISISKENLEIFKKGIFSYSMDDKWNVFILDDIVHFSRSWTNHCIYKVTIKTIDQQIILQDFKVNRDKNQYRFTNIEEDTILLKKLIQSYLKRDDLYSDPKLQLPLIKHVVEQGKHKDDLKSIGSSNVGFINGLYKTLISPPNDTYFDIQGWTALEKKLFSKPDDELLISLYVQNKQTNFAKTYYFNNDASELLGEIIISKKPDIDFSKL
jgi:hypothetical protein